MPPQEETKKMKMFFSSIKMFLRASRKCEMFVDVSCRDLTEIREGKRLAGRFARRTFPAQNFRSIELLGYAPPPLAALSRDIQ